MSAPLGPRKLVNQIYDLDWRRDESLDVPPQLLTMVTQMELQCYKLNKKYEPVVLWSYWCKSFSQYRVIEQALFRMGRLGLTTLVRHQPQVSHVIKDQPQPWGVITADMIDEFYFHILSLFDFEGKGKRVVRIHNISAKMTKKLQYEFQDAQTLRIMQIFEKQGMGVSVNKEEATVELEAPLWMLDKEKFLAYQRRMYEIGELRMGLINYMHYLSHTKGNLQYAQKRGTLLWPEPTASVPRPLINFWKDLILLENKLEEEGLGKLSLDKHRLMIFLPELPKGHSDLEDVSYSSKSVLRRTLSLCEMNSDFQKAKSQ